jgi:hypothetical protein
MDKIKNNLNKRFWVFAYQNKYSHGGLRDIILTTNELDKTLIMGEWDNYYIFDSEFKEIVFLNG